MLKPRRSFLGIGVALACVWFAAGPAGALALHPTDWRSTIISIAPSTESVSIDVLNGGEAIRLRSIAGHVIEIPGYRNEPYLRVTANGDVQANVNSPTWWANRTGNGTGEIPANADPEAVPEWSTIGTNGTATWHDHRIHAMPGITGATDWTVLVTVDGQPLVIRGQLTKLPSHGPLLEVLIAVALTATLVGFGFRWEWRTAIAAAIGGSSIAFCLSIGAWTETPSGFSRPWFTLLASSIALAGALLTAALRGRPRTVRLVMLVSTIAALGWWVALNLPAFTAASIPNALTEPVVRAGLAIVTGCVVGLGFLVVMTGGFSDTDRRQAEDASLRVVSE